MSRLNDDAKSSVNTTSLSNASDIIHAISLPNAARPLNSSNAAPQLPITNHQSPILSVGTMCRPLNNSNPWVPKNKLRQCLFAKKWGLQSKPRLVCLLWGEGERRYMSPNDAEHQSLRPCYRTRRVL